MPGLYAWLRRHPRLVDGVLALLLLTLGGVLPAPAVRDLAMTVPFAIAMAVPVVFRRAYPVTAFAAVIAVGALQVLLVPRPAGYDLAVLIVLYTLAACRPRPISLRGLASCLAGAAVAVLRWHPANTGYVSTEAVVFGAPVLLAWVLGDSARCGAATTRRSRSGPRGWNGSATRRPRSRWRPNAPGSPVRCTTS